MARVRELESALSSSRDELSRDKELLDVMLQEARAEAEALRQDLERERSDMQRLSQAAATRAEEEAESGRIKITWDFVSCRWMSVSCEWVCWWRISNEFERVRS